MSFIFEGQSLSTFDQDNQTRSKLKGISYITKAVDIGSVTNATMLDFDVTGFKGLRVPSTSDPGDVAIVTMGAAMTANVGITNVRVKDQATITIRVANPSAAPIDPASLTMTFLIFHLGDYSGVGSA